MIDLGGIGGKLEVDEDRAEKQPRAELAADEIGVLALPAEPRRGGERLLHHGRGVDEHFYVSARLARMSDDEGGERFQPALDDVVIVAMARIDRDRANLPSSRVASSGSSSGP